MVNTEEYETKFKEQQDEANALALKLSLARNGIDPEVISRQDYDQVKRYNDQIMESDATTNRKLQEVQAKAAIEHNELVGKIQEIFGKYFPDPLDTAIAKEVTDEEALAKLDANIAKEDTAAPSEAEAQAATVPEEPPVPEEVPTDPATETEVTADEPELEPEPSEVKPDVRGTGNM